jgi:hypothetical protein
VSVLDYTAAILTTVAWAVTGVAFVLWWQAKLERRVAVLLLVAGFGTVVSGVGNLLEDVFALAFGEYLFTYGGMTGVIAMVAAGVLWLTVNDVLRWSGLFLLALIVGSVFPDDGGQFLMAISLRGLGLWLFRHRSATQSAIPAGLPPTHNARLRVGRDRTP